MKKKEQEGEQKNLQEEKKRSSETEDHQKQHLATLTRLKQGNENELERKLGLEKVVARLAMETKKSKTELPNGSVWPWRRRKKEQQDWRRW